MEKRARNMILVIDVCKERLHSYEFVKPIEDILKNNFITKNYLDLGVFDFENIDGVIICGTSLKDSDYLENMDRFSWIKNFGKPILGICAGFQIIGKTFGCELRRNEEIGYFYEDFKSEFLGVSGKIEVYHLHNNYVEFSEDFDLFVSSNISQAIKHREKNIYGTLFHPEVRNKEMILNFANLCK